MPKCQRSRKRLVAARQRKAAKRRAEMKRRRSGKRTVQEGRRRGAKQASGISPVSSPIGMLGNLLAINGALHRMARGR